MDGDCKIMDELNKARVYGDTPILKNKCANHMVKRGYNGVKGLGYFWTMNHELGKVILKVRAALAKTGASGTNEKKQRGRGKGRSSSRGRARSSSKGRGQSCTQADSDQGPATQGDSDQGPATVVLRDENGDPDESVPLGSMEPLPPLNESICNQLLKLKQPSLTSYFKPMLSHVPIIPNTDEIPTPRIRTPRQSVTKTGKNIKGQQKGKGSVRTIDNFFQVQKRPSGARDSGGPAQGEQTAPSTSGSALSEKDPQGTRRSARIVTKDPCNYSQDDSPHDSSVEQEADWSMDLEVAGSQPVAASIPEPAAACPTPPTFEVPSWLKKHRYPSRTNTKFVLRHIFTNQFCHKVAAKYRLAVYSHCKEGIEAQSRAVLSIPFHELDHIDTTVAQKQHYHRYCGDYCGFKR